MARLLPTRRLMGAILRKLQWDSKCQSPITVLRLRGRMGSGGDGSVLFVSTPAFLKDGAEWSSKIHLLYQLRCELESVFVSDTNDPTRKRDFGPPNFDQKTINHSAEPGGAARVQSRPEVRQSLSREFGGRAWSVPIWAEAAYCGAPDAN